MSDSEKKPLKEILWSVVRFPFLVIYVLLFLILYVVFDVVTWVVLYLATWMFWNTRGINVLYVYSNSSNWQDYIESNILPNLPEKSIILNWSERKSWKSLSLANLTFRFFGGDLEFNPMAIVIRPFRRVKIFRFHKAFIDFKHGKTHTLEKKERDFFEVIKTLKPQK